VSLDEQPIVNEGFSSHERLVSAVLSGWADQGHAALTVRSIARAANLPPSSLYHHFGSVEQLFASAQGYARDSAERWFSEQLEALPRGSDMPPEGAPALLAALVDDWTNTQRPFSIAREQCHLLAAREPFYRPALHAWQDLWTDFWKEVCSRFDLRQYADVTGYLVDSQSALHLMPWRRSIDRLCLQETFEGWGHWLKGSLAGEGPWFEFARKEASKNMPKRPRLNGVSAQIADAAGDALESSGMGGLTHRAVAARAGLTLGVVSYNFRTASDLARAGIEALYHRIVPIVDVETFTYGASEFSEYFPADSASAAPGFTAMQELVLAVARDPALKSVALHLRYLRGRSSGLALQAQVRDRTAVSPLDAAIYSGVQWGRQRALFCSREKLGIVTPMGPTDPLIVALDL
jgi:AcrR family transcriptional regulator